MPGQSSEFSRRQAVRMFIDDTAEEGEDEDEDEEDDPLQSFIQDDESILSGDSERVQRNEGAASSTRNRADALFGGIFERFENQSSDDLGLESRDATPLPGVHLYETEAAGDVDICRLLEDNFYLITVAHDTSKIILRYDFDRVGTEEDAIRNIRDVVKDVLEVWSFQAVRPRLYLLLRNDQNLRAIHRLVVKACPTILPSSLELVSEPLDRAASLRLIAQRPLWSGRWVNIRKGRYQGDVGYAVADDGQWVELLVVPRLDAEDFHPMDDRATIVFDYAGKRAPSPPILPPPGKRRKLVHPSRPPPKLLYSNPLTPSEVSKGGQVSYVEYPGFRFEEDLLVLKCRPSNLLPATQVPQLVWELLNESKNQRVPVTLLPPRPQWTLEYGERVYDCVTGLSGFVNTIEDERISVIGPRREGGEQGDDEVLGWIVKENVLKLFDDFEPVEATFEGHRVLYGWIWPQKTKKTRKRIVEVLVVQMHEGRLFSEMYTFRRNACRTSAFAKDGEEISIGPVYPPPRKGLPPIAPTTVQENPGANVGRCPWIGIRVSIIGSRRPTQPVRDASRTRTFPHGNPHVHQMNDIADDYKGRVGYVISGDLSDKSPSGIVLDVSVFVSGHDKVIRTDYAHVVDERTGWPLRIAYPRRNADRFWAGNAEIQRKETLMFRYPRVSKATQASAASAQRASTPTPAPMYIAPPDSDSIHWILSPRLYGHRIQVKNKQSNAKRPEAFWVTQERQEDNTMVIRQWQNNHKLGKAFDPNDLQPANPGHKAKMHQRWFVNWGKHKGQFCRGVQYHLFDPKLELPSWIVFLIALVPGEADKDLGLLVRVAEMHLVVLEVDEEDRKLNAHHEKRRVSSHQHISLDEDTWDPTVR